MKRTGICFLVLAFLVTAFAGCALSFESVGGTTLQYDNGAAYLAGGASVSQEIRRVDVHWVNGNVKIAYHDGEELVFSEASKETISGSYALRYLVVDDTLTLQYAKSGLMMNVDFTKDLTILVPRKQKNGDATQLVSLDVETVNADVFVDALDVQACEIKNISGRITASFRRELSDLSVKTVSGMVDITAAYVADAEFESVSGDISLCIGKGSDHTPIHSLEVETVSGDLLLVLPECASFAVDFDTVSGAFACDFTNKKTEEAYIIGSGEANAEVKTVSGDVKIQKTN